MKLQYTIEVQETYVNTYLVRAESEEGALDNLDTETDTELLSSVFHSTDYDTIEIKKAKPCICKTK